MARWRRPPGERARCLGWLSGAARQSPPARARWPATARRRCRAGAEDPRTERRRPWLPSRQLTLLLLTLLSKAPEGTLFLRLAIETHVQLLSLRFQPLGHRRHGGGQG